MGWTKIYVGSYPEKITSPSQDRDANIVTLQRDFHAIRLCKEERAIITLKKQHNEKRISFSFTYS